MSIEKSKDAAEPSPASDGSVAGKPVAWAVMLADGERIYDVYAIEEEAKAIDEAVTGNHGVVPLYRHAPVAESATTPTLTDAERGALEQAATVADAACEEAKRWVGVPRWANGGVDDSSWQHVADSNAARAATLRGLLERMK